MSEIRTREVQNTENASAQTAICEDEDSEPPLGICKPVQQSSSRAPVVSAPRPHRNHDRDFGSQTRPRLPSNNKVASKVEVVRIEWKRDEWRSWAVSLAALYANAVTWGTSGSISVLLPTLVTIFKHSLVLDDKTSNASAPVLVEGDAYVHSKVQLVYSVNTASLYLSFFIGTLLIERLGCRLTVLVGVVFSVGGTLIPALWPDVSLWLWCLCFGLANGPGNAMINLASQVALEQSFDRRFGTGAAIASLGLAIANVLFPFLWEALLALAARDNATPVEFVQDRAVGLSLVMFSIVASYLLLLPMLPLFGSPFNMAAKRVVAANTRSSTQPSDRHSRNSSVSSTSSFSSIGPTSSSNELDNITSDSETTPIIKKRSDPKAFYKYRFIYSYFDIPTAGLKYSPSGSEHIIQNSKLVESTATTTSIATASATSSSGSSSGSALAGVREQFREVSRMLRERNVLVFLLSQCAFLGFNSAPDSLSPQQATDLFPTALVAGSLTLVLYGVSQAVGKMLDAPLGDHFSSLFGRTIIFSSGIVLKGLFVGAVPVALGFARRLDVLLTLNSIYGLWDGLQYGMYSALILSLVGSERYSLGLSVAYGMSALPILVGSPLAGLALDVTHNYSPIFAVCGVVISLSGLAMLLIDFERDAQKELDRRLGYEKLISADTDGV